MEGNKDRKRQRAESKQVKGALQHLTAQHAKQQRMESQHVLAGAQRETSYAAELVVQLARTTNEAASADVVQKKLLHKELVLEPGAKKATVSTPNITMDVTAQERRERAQAQRRLRRKKKGRLSARALKQAKVFDIPPSAKKYDLFMGLHELWKTYVTDLISGSLDHIAQLQLSKADFHGCILEVTRTSCPSLLGLRGILLQETENTMKIITEENKIKVIPKRHCEFTIPIGERKCVLYGQHFCFGSHKRSARKFKARNTIAL